MLTEFSFSGFPSPGRKSALFVEVYTQANRGIGYHKYTLQAARAPFMVGMHWFMWMDYAKQETATSGYLPDANMGLVATGETAVYEELGGWIKHTNAEVEATHRAIQSVPPPEPEPQHRPLQRFVPTVDGDISEWPKALAIKPTVVTSLVDEMGADHTYFLSWDGQYLYLAGDIAATPLKHPLTKQARPWERDYLSIQLSPVKARETHAGSSPALFIYPSQPHAIRWYGLEGYRPMPLRVATRRSSRGFTIEARIPGTAVWGFKGRAGASWRIKLRYQNVQEIYQTTWQGIVTLRP
jgi:hypothetical protein